MDKTFIYIEKENKNDLKDAGIEMKNPCGMK